MQRKSVLDPTMRIARRLALVRPSRAWPTDLASTITPWRLRASTTTGLPAVEVHLSDVDSREDFRRTSVLAGITIGRVAGRGAAGYHDALTTLKEALTP